MKILRLHHSDDPICDCTTATAAARADRVYCGMGLALIKTLRMYVC